MTAFTIIVEPDATRDEIAADPVTLECLYRCLRGAPNTPQLPGAIGELTGFPLVVDASLPPGEVRLRRTPPVDVTATLGTAGATVAIKHRFTPGFLADIAREWNAHIAADWPPTRAIAVAHGVTMRAVQRWIQHCRAADLHLEPAGGLRHHYAVSGERR